MARVREVEKSVVEMFMYLNTSRVLKSIGYVSKDIRNSTNQERNVLPKGAKVVKTSNGGVAIGED